MAATNSGFYKKLGAAGAALVIAASIAAVPHIKVDEGRSLVPYRDIAGVLTDCDGNTVNVKVGVNRTHAECDKLTAEAALEYGKNVANNLEVEVSEKTFTSLIRFSYNVGAGAFNSSTALRKINEGDTAAGCEAMMKFACYTVKAGDGVRQKGKPCYSPATGFNKQYSKGLANRRGRERDMCLEGIPK